MPLRLLDGFNGYLQTDAYEGYGAACRKNNLLPGTHYDFRVVTSLTGVYTTVQGRETTAQAEKVPQLVDDTVVSDIVTVLTAASVPGPPSIVRR